MDAWALISHTTFLREIYFNSVSRITKHLDSNLRKDCNEKKMYLHKFFLRVFVLVVVSKCAVSISNNKNNLEDYTEALL